MKENNPRSTRTKEKKRKWLLLFLLLFLVLFGLYRCGMFGSKDDSRIIIGAGVQQGVPSKNRDEPGSNGTEQVSIQLNARPTFADGVSVGDLNIVNPATNVLYLEADIRLTETDEIIYQSGVIPPDHFVGEDKLMRNLHQGEHEAVATVTLFDPNEQDQQFNQYTFSLVIIIEN